MAPSADSAVTNPMGELEALRSELAELRRRQIRSAGEPGRRSPSWLLIPLVVVGSWALSAQTPASSSADIEQRLSALEGLIRRGPGNVTRLSAPFDVVGPNGKVILHVGNDPSTGAVAVWHAAGRPGGNIMIRADNGTNLAGIGTANAGHGVVFAADAKGSPRAQVNGTGSVLVFDQKEHQLAGIIEHEGRGRLGVWHNDARVVTLENDPGRGNSGALTLNGPAGNVIATMKGSEGGAGGALSVMNAAGKPVAGLVGGPAASGAVVVANSSGVGLAEMSVSNDGRGVVQVFGRGQRPVAVLTQAKDRPDGLVQISGVGGPVAHITVGASGGGYFQLNSASGTPTVEAGTLPSGAGMVRVGPQYKCDPVRPATPVIGIPGFEDCLVGSVGGK